MGDGPVTRRARLLASARTRIAELRRRVRLLGALLIAIVGLGLIVAGVADVFPPAGKISAGIALLLLVTFDPAQVRKLTWPR